MSEESSCAVCGKVTTHKCGSCLSVFYCSKEHQKSGWKSHKFSCKPFKVESDEVVGRHLVATRSVEFNETILQEMPLVWGPSQTTVPVCLGCGNEVNEKNSKPCSSCGWPMCSEICEKAPAHIPECRYTVLRGDKIAIKVFGFNHPAYQGITVLRCLYQKQFLPDVWKKLDALESHCDHRKNTQKYEQDRTIAQFLLKFFKLDKTFTEEEVLRVCGIVMVNGHEVPITEPHHVAIYENTSMFEHNCSANCCKSFTEDGGIVLTSGKKIGKGDHLTICYSDPLWGTPNRRHHLFETKFFWCSCNRCSDVTEFGTFFSALKCQNGNCNGFVMPKTFLENTNNEKGEDWVCNKCKTITSSYLVQHLMERIGKDLMEMPKNNAHSCQTFLDSYNSLLHPNHFYLTDVKLALAQQIGQTSKGLVEEPDDMIELKARLCQELENLFEKIAPAEKRLRGSVLFELHAAIAETGRRRALSGDFSPEALRAIMMESKRILQQASTLLKFEPEVLPEGQLYLQTKTNLNGLNAVLEAMPSSFVPI